MTITSPVGTPISGSTDCCAHTVRDGLSATYNDGCGVSWDDEGFSFVHAHPERGDALVTIEEEE